jgi:hypothetical protein
MSPQALPRRRVASPPIPSPPPIPAARIMQFPMAPPSLWRNLPQETQTQIARILAQLLRRMVPMEVTPGREGAGADRRSFR